MKGQPMRIATGEDGAALVTALMLTMLCLVIAMALLSTVILGSKISASQKRYRTALSAAQGGVELLTQEIIPQLMQGETAPGLATEFSSIYLALPQSDCLRQKLGSPSGHWSACSPRQSSDDPGEAPDLVFKLKSDGRRAFVVSSKILESDPGNTDRNGMIDHLEQGTSVSGREEGVRPPHIPGIYNIAVQGERDGGESPEKARLSVLYAY